MIRLRPRLLAVSVVMAHVGVALLACKSPTPSADAGSGASGASTPQPDAGAPQVAATASTADGRALVEGACLSCHTDEMLAQQRLTQAQWSKVVPKMVTWGANLEPAEVAPLVAYLAATYGPDAGPFEPKAVPVTEAVAELSPQDDGPFANGDAERGKATYTEKCSGCHGPEARGHIGVLLVERPVLYRAGDVARTIRRGKGKMLPLALADAEIADVLAHLRRLRHPAPAPPPPSVSASPSPPPSPKKD